MKIIKQTYRTSKHTPKKWYSNFHVAFNGYYDMMYLRNYLYTPHTYLEMQYTIQ